jgi:hypothetical protein
VIAPRHADGEARVRAAFGPSRFDLVVRDDADRGADVISWIDEVSRRPAPRVALLATRGELERAYRMAWGALVGGTFAPFGGHNVWEPGARGCPVVVGPYHDQVSTAVEAIVREGGGEVASGGIPDLTRTGVVASRRARARWGRGRLVAARSGRRARDRSARGGDCSRACRPGPMSMAGPGAADSWARSSAVGPARAARSRGRAPSFPRRRSTGRRARALLERRPTVLFLAST